MSMKTADHDGAYKKLFSNVHMVRALIEAFVSRELADELAFESMTSINVEFRARSLTQRASDLIWRIPSSGEDVYMMLMLEFQSSTDVNMPMRFLTYTAMLYDQLISEGLSLSKSKLPPVLPVVLYNGSSTWNVTTRTLECIDVDTHSKLRDYQPDLSYYLIDIGRLVRAQVEDIDDPASMLFELERVQKLDELRPRLERLVELLDLFPAGLEELYAIWFERVMGPRTKINLTHDDIKHFRKEPTMLSETIDRWHREATEKGLEEGREKGLEEGREEGREEGMLNLLTRLLEARFGPSNTRAEALGTLTTEQIEEVGLRLVTRPDAGEPELLAFELG